MKGNEDKWDTILILSILIIIGIGTAIDRWFDLQEAKIECAAELP